MTQSRAKTEWIHGEGEKGLKGCCNLRKCWLLMGECTPSVRLTAAGVGTWGEEQACWTSGHADLEGRRLDGWTWLELGQQT